MARPMVGFPPPAAWCNGLQPVQAPASGPAAAPCSTPSHAAAANTALLLPVAGEGLAELQQTARGRGGQAGGHGEEREQCPGLRPVSW